MKKIILAVTALVAVATPVVAAAPANAAGSGGVKYTNSRSCITKPEWRSLREGMSVEAVHRLVGDRGVIDDRLDFSDGTSQFDVEYRQCARNGQRAKGDWNYVEVTYENYYYDYAIHDDVITPTFNVSYVGAWSQPY